MTTAPERIVVVGASLAGLTAAQHLRARGYAGALTLVGDEPHRPYDRPPLSKQVLRGLYSADTTLPHPPDLGVEFRLGQPATRLDLSGRAVELGDGSRLPYDRLLIATGTRARPWPNPEEAALAGVFTLRGRDDAQRLGARLQARPDRVVLVGGGFIGFEVASTCRDLDIPVTLLVRDAVPLAAALGPRLGSLIGDVAREKGVDLRLESEIERMEARDGHLVAVTLKDGTRIETDCLVAAIGTLRNVEWLAGSGLEADAGACAATPSAARCTRTAASPRASLLRATSPVGRTRTTTMRWWRSSTGAMPGRKERPPPPTCWRATPRRCAAMTTCPISGRSNSG